MRKTLRARYVAAEIHALLFISMWVLYFAFAEPLLNGPSVVPFGILFIADLPISFVAFGVMFTSSEMGSAAAVGWGMLGTLWWFLIGFAIDTRIKKYRERRAMEAVQPRAPTAADFQSGGSRRTELLIAVGSVAAVIIVSLALRWNGTQGHFEKEKIGNFAFAPDGRSILLVRSRRDSSTLENVNLTSGTSIPISKVIPCQASSPVYSPDGKQIAFGCRTEADDRSQILIMDTNGGNLHPLFASNLDHNDFAAHFAPDGKEIYFARSSSFAPVAGSDKPVSTSWDVHSANLDGKNERSLTDRHFEVFGASFSDDATKVAVSGEISTGPQIHLFWLDDQNKGGTPIHPVIPNGPNPPVISNVILAPDGQSLYFMAATNGKKGFDYDVYRSDLAGNAVEKLTSANGYATDLCVSSDGKTAAFLRWTSRWGSFPKLSRLYVLNLTTKQLTALDVTGRN